MSKRGKEIAPWLIWVIAFVLLVPNILLDFTEPVILISKVINILLPLGVYVTLLSLSKNLGRTILFFIPLMVYCAFQIVLLYLYGNSIIAVDMFLNVATTNYTEATELLANMGLAIATVIILYLPIIAYGIIAIYKRWKIKELILLKTRFAGLCCTAIGIAILIAACAIYPKYNPLREIFPANVISNTFQAIHRYNLTKEFNVTSQNFSYKATSLLQPSDSTKEIYVLVIGETARAENWSLLGYDRLTNPRLSTRKNVIAFPHVMSESNTTHKSVPLLLSHLSANDFGDSIYYTKSLISAFNEAGFGTAFFSTQRRNGSFIDYYGEEAATHSFIVEEGENQFDNNLLSHLEAFIDTANQTRLLVVLHSYGSHFNYNDRYTEDFKQFLPTNYLSASAKNRPELINAYDNTILYTDAFLDSIIGILDSTKCPSAMLYVSDHGEDIFDDGGNRFLHASPTPTIHQLHVPMIFWTSDIYDEKYPDIHSWALKNSQMQISSSQTIFHTLLQTAGVSTPYFDPTKSISNSQYSSPIPLFLNDYNEPISYK